METDISSVFFLFERLECHNNHLLTEQEGPTGCYHMTRTAPRVISQENVKQIPFRAVRVEVIGPGKRVVKLETCTPHKIDAIKISDMKNLDS